MLDNYELIDRYRRESGRVLLTGTQALVRIGLMQRTMDVAAGLNTAGFVSGYRGSPLGMRKYAAATAQAATSQGQGERRRRMIIESEPRK